MKSLLLTKRFFTVILALTAVLPVFSNLYGDINQADADLRVKALEKAVNTEDSLKILLDVYDLSDKVNRNLVGMQIIELAKRSDNNAVMADVINDLASATDDTKTLRRLIEMSESISHNEDRKSVETVLEMEEAKARVLEMKGKTLQNNILETSLIGMSVGGDPYKEIQNIYRALVYLGASSQGPMYYEYLRRLEDLVKKLPEKDYAIKNLYYTTAAIFYTRKRDYEKAIESDRELIKQLQLMEKEYEKAGRENHDFNDFYYTSYRRMLRNFRGLKPQEIEEVYAKCKEFADKDETVKYSFENGGLAKSYYYFATEQYDKAVPELKKALNDPDISAFRKQELLGLLAGSQNKTGDQKGELESLREYALLSIADRQQRMEDSNREIELRTKVNQLLAKQRLVDEERREKRNSMRKVAITLVYVLALVLIFVLRSYFRLRSKVKELQSRNNKLRVNIEQIFDDGMPRGTSDLRHSKNRLKG
ncbi:MAG: hypothetical protein J1E95_04020 [Muribaculaceae bacterium]|nr:hypothetical protein [Muribaculaceae bacterium]